MVGPAEGVVSGILGKGAAVVRLRSHIAGSGESVEGEVLTLGAFERIITLVADEGEARSAHMGWQGKQTEFGR